MYSGINWLPDASSIMPFNNPLNLNFTMDELQHYQNIAYITNWNQKLAKNAELAKISAEITELKELNKTIAENTKLAKISAENTERELKELIAKKDVELSQVIISNKELAKAFTEKDAELSQVITANKELAKALT